MILQKSIVTRYS